MRRARGPGRPFFDAASLVIAALGLLGISAGSPAAASAPSFDQIDRGERGDRSERVGTFTRTAPFPIDFEINRGQTDSAVKFLSRSTGFGFFLTEHGAVIRLAPRRKTMTRPASAGPARADRSPNGADAVVRMTWLGASPQPLVEGVSPLEARSNYFIGRDASRWVTNVPHFAKVRYHGLYPGIDLVYYGQGSGGDGGVRDDEHRSRLEYDIVVSSGADPGAIRLAFDGAQAAVLDERGDLLLTTEAGVITQHRPAIYQEIGGVRRPVAGAYVVRSPRMGRYEIGVRVASYDPSRPLVIDPRLSSSSYWGGANDDVATAIAVDANTGDLYLAGYTDSADYPKVDPVPGASFTGSATYAFVTKLNASQTAVSYSTFVGGNTNEAPSTTLGLGVGVDRGGSAYLTGWTDATDFPVSPNDPDTNDFAFQLHYGGGASDAFIMRINPTGNAVTYSTYLGGTGFDQGNGIKVNGTVAYVVGTTASTDFPTQAPWQSDYHGGGGDAFLAKLNKTGKVLFFSTYLGGSGQDQGLALDVGLDGAITLTGSTNSTDFPTKNPVMLTSQAYDGSQYHGGVSDAFVTRLSNNGRTLFYSSYLGGGGNDVGNAIVADAGATAYVTGVTTSTNFPILKPIQPDNNGGMDVFISRLNPSGELFKFSTYLGGSGDDVAYGIVKSPEGFVYVTGWTDSSDTDPVSFPIVDPLQATYGGGNRDAFLTRMSTTYTLDYSTFWGGDGDETALAIVYDVGAAYITGMTTVGTFQSKSPVAPGVLTSTNTMGHTDVFLVRVDDTQANGCDMGSGGLSGWSPGWPGNRSGRRIDLGLPVVIGLGAWFWWTRRLQRIRRS
jgi:Beta-propeller repeat